MACGGTVPVHKKWQQIEEEITCSICGDLFTDPKTMPCLHTFCKRCIEKSIESNKKMASVICCPLCRTPLPQDDITSLPTNFTINRLVEIFGNQKEVGRHLELTKIMCSNCEDDLPAFTWCIQCENGLCEQCNDAHQRMKVFKLHKIITVKEFVTNPELSLSTTESPGICEIHGKPLDLYCKSCSYLICRDCTLKDHRREKHDFDFIDDVVHEEKEKIKQATVPLLEQVRNGIVSMEDSQKEIDIKSEANRRKIQGVYGKVYTLLKQQEEEALEKVNTLKKSFKKTLAMQKDAAKLIETQLLSCANFYDDGISTHRRRQLLTHKNSIDDRVEDLTKQVKHASIDPECRADDMIVTCVKPTIFANNSVCDVSGIPHVPHCSVHVSGPLENSTNPVKVTVMLKDVYGFSVVRQSKVIEICCDKGKKFLQNVRIEEESSGVYEIWYNPKKEVNHLLSVYWRKHIVNHVEVEMVVNIRDYANIREVAKVVDRYGHYNLQIVCPYLMAKGISNKVIVRNNSTDQLVVFDAQLRFLYEFGGTGNGHGRFRNATGMAVDNKGYLYIGDHTLHCIQKLTLYGQFISQFGCEGTAEGQFKIPTGLLFSQSQLLFVCDSENHRIQVFLNELFSYTFGKFGNLPSYFNTPNDLALNSDEDQLFVTDKCNDRVQVFTPSGQFLRIFGNFTVVPFKLLNPTGIYYTPDNHLLITSYSNEFLFVFKEDGRFVSATEGIHKGKRRFSCPFGVIMLENGQIVIASVNTHRLIVF